MASELDETAAANPREAEKAGPVGVAAAGDPNAHEANVDADIATTREAVTVAFAAVGHTAKQNG